MTLSRHIAETLANRSPEERRHLMHLLSFEDVQGAAVLLDEWMPYLMPQIYLASPLDHCLSISTEDVDDPHQGTGSW